MSFILSMLYDYLLLRKQKKAEKKRMREHFREIEARELRRLAPPPGPDNVVGWTKVDGKRVKKKPFDTVLEQISSVDVKTIKPHIDSLRSAIERADELGVTAEPFTLAFVGPPRQGKTQLSLNILKILGALGIICVERSTQDEFCDDIARSASEACVARDDQGNYKYFPNITDSNLRYEKCKPEVLFLDEFQSKVVNPHDVPLVLNGVIPLKWKPPMADMTLKGISFNPVIWIMSCNNEFVQHDYSVTAVRDRMHRRLVVLDGKAYDQTCKKDLAPSGDFLGGFRTCKGIFGVWEKYVAQETQGRTAGASIAHTMGAMPSVGSRTNGRSMSKSVNKTVSNQKFREVKDTLSIARPRCNHMQMVTFTDLIVDLLNSAEAKLREAIKGAEAVNARIEVIRKTMTKLSADAEPFCSAMQESLEEVRPVFVSSGFVSEQDSVPETEPEPVRPSLFD